MRHWYQLIAENIILEHLDIDQLSYKEIVKEHFHTAEVMTQTDPFDSVIAIHFLIYLEKYCKKLSETENTGVVKWKVATKLDLDKIILATFFVAFKAAEDTNYSIIPEWYRYGGYEGYEANKPWLHKKSFVRWEKEILKILEWKLHYSETEIVTLFQRYLLAESLENPTANDLSNTDNFLEDVRIIDFQVLMYLLKAAASTTKNQAKLNAESSIDKNTVCDPLKLNAKSNTNQESVYDQLIKKLTELHEDISDIKKLWNFDLKIIPFMEELKEIIDSVDIHPNLKQFLVVENTDKNTEFRLVLKKMIREQLKKHEKIFDRLCESAAALSKKKLKTNVNDFTIWKSAPGSLPFRNIDFNYYLKYIKLNREMVFVIKNNLEYSVGIINNFCQPEIISNFKKSIKSHQERKATCMKKYKELKEFEEFIKKTQVKFTSFKTINSVLLREQLKNFYVIITALPIALKNPGLLEDWENMSAEEAENMKNLDQLIFILRGMVEQEKFVANFDSIKPALEKLDNFLENKQMDILDKYYFIDSALKLMNDFFSIKQIAIFGKANFIESAFNRLNDLLKDKRASVSKEFQFIKPVFDILKRILERREGNVLDARELKEATGSRRKQLLKQVLERREGNKLDAEALKEAVDLCRNRLMYTGYYQSYNFLNEKIMQIHSHDFFQAVFVTDDKMEEITHLLEKMPPKDMSSQENMASFMNATP